jgi:hypothetical protein
MRVTAFAIAAALGGTLGEHVQLHEQGGKHGGEHAFGKKQGDHHELPDEALVADEHIHKLEAEVLALNEKVAHLEKVAKEAEAAAQAAPAHSTLGRDERGDFNGLSGTNEKNCHETHRYSFDLPPGSSFPLMPDRFPQMSTGLVNVELFGHNPKLAQGDMSTVRAWRSIVYRAARDNH